MRLRSCLLFSGLALLALLSAPVSRVEAALPQVDRLEPLGVVRGEETTVVFHGNRLKDAHQVLTDVDGIEILSVKPLDNKKVEVTLRANASLEPGLYPVRLVTETGIANLRLVGVGSMPRVEESEPNNDFASPQQIELNCTVEGVVKREDVDHYRVDLKAGQRLTAEIEGIRLAYTLRNRNVLDPYIAILDEGRFEVATSDDSSLLQQDGVCTFTAPEDGQYTVLVRHSSFGGSGDAGYRLHVGNYPRPVAVIPGGGQPGSILDARLIDVDGTEARAKFQLPSEPSEAWPAITETERGISPSPNWLRVNPLPVVMEQEPNDDRRKSPVSEAPAAFCGVIEKEGDFDCFSFECKKGQRFRVQVFAREVLRSPLDGVLNVFGPDNGRIKSSDDNRRELDPFLDFTAKQDGRHTVRIYDHLRGGSPLHHYRIEVTRFEPGFDLVLKELRRDHAMVVPVPAGGAAGIVVQAQRSGYGGQIDLELEGLPEGVAAKAYPMPDGRNEIPVLLTASEGAKPQAALFEVYGTGSGDNFNVRGQLRQRHNLVLGRNRRDMWTYDTDRAAAAVTQPAPFTIELVQPKTPIVRSGSKKLKVRLERQEGFDGRVSLRTLYNPPGVGINNSRRIDPGKTETTIPITANGRAGIGEWPLVMVASYGTDNGTAQIATNAIMLDVQDSLFRYDFPRSAAEQGTDTQIAVGMEILREYEGEAEVELLGLPNGVSSPEATQQVKPGDTSVSFPIAIAEDAKTGKHKTLVVRSRVAVGDEEIIQTTGTGELRVDKPLPKKSDEPKKDKKANAKKSEKPKEAKPLSRLEQLRQQKANEGN